MEIPAEISQTQRTVYKMNEQIDIQLHIPPTYTCLGLVWLQNIKSFCFFEEKHIYHLLVPNLYDFFFLRKTQNQMLDRMFVLLFCML